MTANRPEVGHSHRLPGWLWLGLAVIVLGLVGGIALVAEQAVATNQRLTLLEQYVAGKGAARDRDSAALAQRIDDAVCRVLDQLQAGGRLDVVRREYRCGPGLPPSPPAAGRPAVTPGASPTRPPSPSAAPTTSPQPGPASHPAAPSTSSRPTPASPAVPPVCQLAPLLCPP